MKPCKRNAERIAELAMGSLSGETADQLREHLQNCTACREYFNQMSRVTHALSTGPVQQDIEASEFFHRQLVSRLESKQACFAAAALWNRLFGSLSNQVLAAAGTAVLALIVAIFVLGPRHGQIEQIAQKPIPTHSPGVRDLQPTFANYQKVANES